MRVNAFFEPQRTDIPDKECAWCGAAFKPHNGKQIYCCRECKTERILADQHMRRREERRVLVAAMTVSPRKCVVCDGPMLSLNPRHKTCSPACRARWESQRKAIAKRGSYQPVMATCVVCGKLYAKVRYSLTCSPECSRQHDRDNDRARHAARKRGDIHIPQSIGPAWNLNYDPYADGMVFMGFDGATIPATSPQALPVY